jgi:DNA polymerase III alpha subunit (gram-positive type)
MIRFFNHSWLEVPTAWIDTETTGIKAGYDKCVQIGVVRFEGGKVVDSGACEINPGMPIPPSATEIHGITDEMVKDAPTIEEWFSDPRTKRLLEGAQPGAYNASFDRNFVPPFGDDWTWPWVDSLSLVRKVDRFVSGKGRHKLTVAAQRHGIELIGKAHSAHTDATAAGQLFYKLGAQVWLSKQPPREATP